MQQKEALQKDEDCILNTQLLLLGAKILEGCGQLGTDQACDRADSSSKNNGYSLLQGLPTAAGAEGGAVKHREQGKWGELILVWGKAKGETA